MEKYFKLTKNRHPYFEAWQIKATRDFALGGYRVKKGDLGGYVASEEVLSDSWLDDKAVVIGTKSRVINALVTGDVAITGTSTIAGYGSSDPEFYSAGFAKVHGSGRGVYITDCDIRGYIDIKGSVNLEECQISKDVSIVSSKYTLWVANSTIESAYLYAYGLIKNSYVGFVSLAGELRLNEAHITKEEHVMAFGSVGSEGSLPVLYKTKTKEGHRLTVGCWSGTVDTLREEVDHRQKTIWVNLEEAPAAVQDLWRKQYDGLEELCKASVELWSHSY